MSGSAPVSVTEIEAARRQIASAQSLDEIHAIVERFSAAATRDGGVLYSGMVNAKDHSGKVARIFADKADVAIIDDTPRGQLLSNADIRKSIFDAAKRVFIGEGQNAILAERSADYFIKGDPKAPPQAATSIENCAWGRASREFAQSLHGDVTFVVHNAEADRIFARDELKPTLENSRVNHVMGQPRDDVRALFEREGLAGIQSASRAHIESLFPQLPESVRAAYAKPTVAELAASDAAATGVRAAAGTAFVVATVGIDAAQTARAAHSLSRDGNAPAADSQIMHFATRNLGMLGGAALGSSLGAAAGIESGPGALVTGAIGGIGGAIGGERLAQWMDERRIDTQTDRTGQAWSRDAAGRWTHDAHGAPVVADGRTSRELDFHATTTAAELALGRPPIPDDPSRIAAGPNDATSVVPRDWQRDAASGRWERDVVHAGGRFAVTTHEVATPERAMQLNRAYADVIARNVAQSANATAMRYEAAYDRNGWREFGPMPAAIANVSPDRMLASDGTTYQRSTRGAWTNDDWHFTRVASGNVAAELDTTHAALQAGLARSAHDRRAVGLADVQRGIDALRADTGKALPKAAEVEPWDGRITHGTFVDLGQGAVAQHCGRGNYTVFDVAHDLGGTMPPLGQAVTVDRGGQVQEPMQAQSLGRSR